MVGGQPVEVGVLRLVRALIDEMIADGSASDPRSRALYEALRGAERDLANDLDDSEASLKR